MNLQNLLYESLKRDEYLLAYTIFWALQKGFVVGSDGFDRLRGVDVDFSEVEKLRSENVLGVKEMKLWSLRKDQYEYVFIFAEDKVAARGLFLSAYGHLPLSVTNADTRMDTLMWDELNGYETFWEMRDRTLKFPCIVATYDAYKKSAEEVEQEYCKKFNVTLRKLG